MAGLGDRTGDMVAVGAAEGRCERAAAIMNLVSTDALGAAVVVAVEIARRGIICTAAVAGGAIVRPLGSCMTVIAARAWIVGRESRGSTPVIRTMALLTFTQLEIGFFDGVPMEIGRGSIGPSLRMNMDADRGRGGQIILELRTAGKQKEKEDNTNQKQREYFHVGLE